MRSRTIAAVGVLAFVALVFAVSWFIDERAAWARIEQTRTMGILNAAGDDTTLLKEGGTVGLPVAIVSGGASDGNWTTPAQNKVLAQCGIGKTALDTATSKKVTIKADDAVTDDIWCNVGGTVDEDVGFRVGKDSEGIAVKITDPANIECCGTGAATFKISVIVEG